MEVFRLKKYDLDDVKRLIDLANKNDLNVLEIETKKGRRIRIEKNNTQVSVQAPSVAAAPAVPAAPATAPVMAVAPAAVAAPAPQPEAAPPVAVAAPAPQPEAAPPVAPSVPQGKTIDAPMVGVFYQAPSPDAEPYVKVGQSVKKGDTVCIIEAMKLMNEIQAEQDGIIAEILVKNGEIVEYGKPMFVIQ